LPSHPWILLTWVIWVWVWFWEMRRGLVGGGVRDIVSLPGLLNLKVSLIPPLWPHIVGWSSQTACVALIRWLGTTFCSDLCCRF
jgi:hypothetical protein